MIEPASYQLVTPARNGGIFSFLCAGAGTWFYWTLACAKVMAEEEA